MRHQPVLADLDSVGEAAFDHVPTEHPLRRAKRENPGKRPRKAARNVAANAEAIVVGSAIVNQIAKYGKSADLVPCVKEFVKSLVDAVKAFN